MSAHLAAIPSQRHAPIGPAVVRTKSGVEIDVSLDRWAYRDGVYNVSLDFAELKQCAPALLQSIKATLRWYAERHSPNHLQNAHGRILHFVRTLGGLVDSENITAADLLNYRSSLSENQAWYLGTLSGILKRWHRLGYPGVSDDALSLLEQLRLRGNAKGVAVLTMDPEHGPFTPIETEALQSALNRAYESGQIELSDYVLAWLYLLLGQRNTQHAALKVCDVRVGGDADLGLTYSIMMPSAKKGGSHPRSHAVERPLIEQFGAVLAEHARRVREQFVGVLPDTSMAPLFPGRNDSSAGFEYHRTAKDLQQRLTKILESLQVVSERTGEPLNITPRRFRRTIATRAAEEGHGPLVIAKLLDHADTQNVGVYTANSPAIIDRIDRAIAMEMAPLAQAFAGVIADGKIGEHDPAKRIVDLRVDQSGKAMGECGKHGFCGFNAPIACYTCNNFQAWLDGPHEAVLSHLLDRRERLLTTTDKRIASINDRTILAVAAVVQRCAELNAAAERRQQLE